ncbi:hypothetical protein KL939_000491 [Ogataea angusta]|nr:hypothetical protein KL939_000491 [Ogataea angusta]
MERVLGSPMKKIVHSGSVGQRPRLGHAVIQVVGREVGPAEEAVRGGRVVQRDVQHQDALPAVRDVVDLRAQHVLPLLLDKRRAPDQRRDRSDRQHVDAVDVLDVGSKVRGVRDLVLEPDAAAVVADELGGHHAVVLRVQEVDVHGSFRDGEHQVGAVRHVGVVDDRGPDLHGVREVVVLARALLVLAVRVDGDSVRDGVAEIKVEVAEDREVRVVARRVGHVSHQGVDPVLDAAGPQPAQVGVHKRTQRGGVDVVAVVEVVVVVERVTVVDRRVAVGHAARRADAAPVGLVAQRVRLAVAAEPLDGLFQRRQQRLRLVGVLQHVVAHIQHVRVFVEDLARGVHGVQVGGRVHVCAVLVCGGGLDGGQFGVGVRRRREPGDRAPGVLADAGGERLGHLELVGEIRGHDAVDGVVERGRSLGARGGRGERGALVRHGVHDGGAVVGGAGGGVLERVRGGGARHGRAQRHRRRVAPGGAVVGAVVAARDLDDAVVDRVGADDVVGVLERELARLAVAEGHVHDPGGAVVEHDLVLVGSGARGGVAGDGADADAGVDLRDQVVVHGRHEAHALDEGGRERAGALRRDGHVDRHLPEVGELERGVRVEVAGAQTQRHVARRGVEVRRSALLVGLAVHALAGGLVGHGQSLVVGLSGVPQGVRVGVNIGGLVTEGQITPKVVCLDGTVLCHPTGHRHRGGGLRKQRDGLVGGDGREDVAGGFTRSWPLAGGTDGQGKHLHVANILE